MSYLYNGVGPLPALPKLDDDKKEAFKYALIIAKDQKAAVNFFDTPVYFKGYEYGSTSFPRVIAETDFTSLNYGYSSESNAWNIGPAENQHSAASGIVFSMPIVWSNYPVYTTEGKLYLNPSTPVPVSPVKLNPALLVQSFFTGQALRRSRGK